MIQFQFFSLVLFAVAMLFTPGPNNAMLAFSGARFGVRKTRPHILGVVIGFTLMLLILGLGLWKLLHRFPMLGQTLNISGLLFIVWYTYKIIVSEPPKNLELRSNDEEKNVASGEKKRKTKPLGFLQATLFQWINGKAWTIGAIVLGRYVRPDFYFVDLAAVCMSFLVVGTMSATTWCYFGTQIGRLFKTVKIYRLFCFTMAMLMLASVAVTFGLSPATGS